MEEWLQVHSVGGRQVKAIGPRDLDADDTLYAHDPLFQLPAISNALGPLLPSILKRLLLPSFRLLIYVPAGAPTHRAAGIAFALGELAYAACQFGQSGGQCPATGASAERHGLVIRGLIGLHDIAKLQDENDKEQLHGHAPNSWLAWTTDKILLDKCQLYDAVLDLSPMMASSSHDADADFLMMPTALPCFLCTYRWQTADGRARAELKKHKWTTREFAVFRGLDEQASLSAISRPGRRRSSLGRRSSQSSLQPVASSSQRRLHMDTSPTKTLSQQRTTSTFLAFLRFWLSSLWILPHQWRINLRNSYGYVPLSIRSDGGVRASIMLLPDDDFQDSDEDSDEEQGGESSQHLSLPSGSPVIKRLSLEGEEAMEEEDDPILAACGATQASLRLRKARSYSKTGAKQFADAVSHQLDADGRPISPMSILKVSSTRGLETGLEDSVLSEARESVKLSFCIYQTWSLWIRELVMGVQDLLEEKLMRERTDETSELDESTPLQTQEKVLYLTARELSDLTMSPANQTDIDLILHLASTVTDRDVTIQRSWWSLASCVWW